MMAPELLKVLLEVTLRPLTTAGVRINLELADVFSSGCTIFFNTSLEVIDHAFGTETTILTNIQNSNAVLKEKE